MHAVTLSFPVLVQYADVEGKQQYLVRPFFMSYPSVTHRRYDRALGALQKVIQRTLKHGRFDRETLDTLLWYNFNPEIEFKILKAEYSLGKQVHTGRFSMGYFDLNGQRIVSLPAFGPYFFIAKKDDNGKYNLQAQTREVIEKLIRSLKQSEGGSEFEPETLYATQGEFVTTCDITFNLSYGDFKFKEDNAAAFFNFFNNDTEFSGAVEAEKTGYELNALYPAELRRAYCREDLLKRLDEIVWQGERTPIVLVGGAGVGKMTLLHELVFRYLKANESKDSETLEKIWHIDPNRVIAGMSIVGMWQKRVESILKYLANRESSKKPINDKLLISNPVALLRIGKSSQNSMTMADVLKPHIEQRRLQVLMTATPEEWKVVQEKNRRFADLFQVIRIDEPTEAEAVNMMLELRRELETDYDCIITTAALATLFDIRRAYFRRQAIPGSVAKLLRQLAVKHKYTEIDVNQAQEEFQSYSGLNQAVFDANTPINDADIRTYFKTNLVGQEAAVEALCEAVHQIKAKLNNPERPLASFMFIGPTGVGKTQGAKVLCDYLLGNEDRLMRFDMNEYLDEYSAMRLVGDAYNPEGLLTGAVRYNPFGIVLLDEIEKAHPKVHDLLLQVLDDGRLTDSLGRTVDFTNTIIIMTSNVGAQEQTMRVGFGSSENDDAQVYRQAVERAFRPEFVNRIDKIVVFKPLAIDHILGIAQLQIKELLRRDGFVRRTTILSISADALEWVARRGFDARMGGRALRRQIERDLTALSAEQLLRTRSEQPIIFNIDLEDQKLVPRIRPLEFAEPLARNWMPSLPAEALMRKEFGTILRQLEQLEQNLAREFGHDDDSISDADDWLYYDFKERLAILKNDLKDILLGFGSSFFDNYNTTILRLNSSIAGSVIFSNKTNDNNDKYPRILLRDKLFMESAIEELRQGYQHAPSQFNKIQSVWLGVWLDLQLLHLQAKGFRTQISQIVHLSVESLLVNMGEDETTYLLDCYADLLDHLGIQFARQGNTLRAEGYALYNLLKGEEGIHLFYKTHQNPLPVKVNITLRAKNAPPKSSDEAFRVLRLYDISLGVQHRQSTITDLRSGYTNLAAMHPEEFKLLLFAGVV